MKINVAESENIQKEAKKNIMISLPITFFGTLLVMTFNYVFCIELISGIAMIFPVFFLLPIANFIVISLFYCDLTKLSEIMDNSRVISKFKSNYYRGKKLPKLSFITESNDSYFFKFSQSVWHLGVVIQIRKSIFLEIPKLIGKKYQKINGRLIILNTNNERNYEYKGEDAEDIEFLMRLVKEQYERVEKVIQLYKKLERGEITEFQYVQLLSKCEMFH